MNNEIALYDFVIFIILACFINSTEFYNDTAIDYSSVCKIKKTGIKYF